MGKLLVLIAALSLAACDGKTSSPDAGAAKKAPVAVSKAAAAPAPAPVAQATAQPAKKKKKVAKKSNKTTGEPKPVEAKKPAPVAPEGAGKSGPG